MPLRWTVPRRYPRYYWERCLYLYYVKNMSVAGVARDMHCHATSVWRMLARFNKGEPLEAKGGTGARHVDRTITPLILLASRAAGAQLVPMCLAHQMLLE